jgi:hypothetical protein
MASDLSDYPGFDLAVESDRRVMARETKPHFEPWFRESLGLKPGQDIPEEFTTGKIYNVYQTRGAAAETGSYPEGPPFTVTQDLSLTEGTGVFGDKSPVRQIAPPVKAAYGRMSRALRREDAKTNVGVAWSGAYSGRSRDADLLLEGQPGRGPGGRGGMEPQEFALSSALGLANLNIEQGFTFPWDVKKGSPAYPEDELEKFKEVGYRKSYVERDGQNVPLDDDCVEVVSLTPKGPIYKSTGKPGCP